jgi:hypothetical protein
MMPRLVNAAILRSLSYSRMYSIHSVRSMSSVDTASKTIVFNKVAGSSSPLKGTVTENASYTSFV